MAQFFLFALRMNEADILYLGAAVMLTVWFDRARPIEQVERRSIQRLKKSTIELGS